MSTPNKNEIKELTKLISAARALRKDGNHSEALKLLAPHEEKWGNKSIGFVREQAMALFKTGTDNKKAIQQFDKIITAKDGNIDIRMEALFCNVVLSGKLDLADRAMKYSETALNLNGQYKDKQIQQHKEDLEAAQKAAKEKAAKKTKKSKKKEAAEDKPATTDLLNDPKPKKQEVAPDDFSPKDHVMAHVVMGCALEIQLKTLSSDEEKSEMIDRAIEHLNKATKIDPAHALAESVSERLMEKSMDYLHIEYQEINIRNDNDPDTNPNSASDTPIPFNPAASGDQDNNSAKKEFNPDEDDIPLADEKPQGAPEVEDGGPKGGTTPK